MKTTLTIMVGALALWGGAASAGAKLDAEEMTFLAKCAGRNFDAAQRHPVTTPMMIKGLLRYMCTDPDPADAAEAKAEAAVLDSYVDKWFAERPALASRR